MGQSPGFRKQEVKAVTEVRRVVLSPLTQGGPHLGEQLQGTDSKLQGTDSKLGVGAR